MVAAAARPTGRYALTTQNCFLIKSWVGVKNFGFTEKQKHIEQGSRGYPGPGGV